MKTCSRFLYKLLKKLAQESRIVSRCETTNQSYCISASASKSELCIQTALWSMKQLCRRFYFGENPKIITVRFPSSGSTIFGHVILSELWRDRKDPWDRLWYLRSNTCLQSWLGRLQTRTWVFEQSWNHCIHQGWYGGYFDSANPLRQYSSTHS